MIHQLQTVLAEDENRALLQGAQALDAQFRAKLSAPFVVSVPPEWDTAAHKVIMVGQETRGWGYYLGEQWHCSLAEAIDHQDILAPLARNYREFDFAEGHPAARGPFWRAHRELATALEGAFYRAVLWSNLVRVDFSGGNPASANMWWNLTWPEAESIANWQRTILPAEVSDSGAKAVLFFTGPDYDFYIEKTFPGIAHETVIPDESTRVIARLVHEGLPRAAFRTYHPASLQRQRRWPLLNKIIELIRAEAA